MEFLAKKIIVFSQLLLKFQFFEILGNFFDALRQVLQQRYVETGAKQLIYFSNERPCTSKSKNN